MKIWNIIDLEGEFLDTKVQRYRGTKFNTFVLCTFKTLKLSKKS